MKKLKWIFTLCILALTFLFVNGSVSNAESTDSEAFLKSLSFNTGGNINILEEADSGVTYTTETIIHDDMSSEEINTYFFDSKELFIYHVSPLVARDYPIIIEYSPGATCKINGIEYSGESLDTVPSFNPAEKGWNIIEITSKDGKVTNTYYFMHIGNVRRWRNMNFAYWNFIPEPEAVTIADKPVLEVIQKEFEKQVESKWPEDYEVNSEEVTKKINDGLAKIDELEKAEADKTAAEDFAKLVAALKGDGTDSDEAIAAAKAAYEALSPEAKELAKDDFAKLTAAEKAVAEKKAAEEAAKKTSDTVKKGDTFTIKGYNYIVTKVSGKTGEVSFTSCTNKKIKKVTIPATVSNKGCTFKVTEIQSKALKGYKKLAAVTVGKNITNIGANAFNGDVKLKKITVKSTGLKKVGAKALKGIHKKAVIKVPKKMLKKYKKLFKGKGQKKTVKIK